MTTTLKYKDNYIVPMLVLMCRCNFVNLIFIKLQR